MGKLVLCLSEFDLFYIIWWSPPPLTFLLSSKWLNFILCCGQIKLNCEYTIHFLIHSSTDGYLEWFCNNYCEYGYNKHRCATICVVYRSAIVYILGAVQLDAVQFCFHICDSDWTNLHSFPLPMYNCGFPSTSSRLILSLLRHQIPHEDGSQQDSFLNAFMIPKLFIVNINFEFV